MSQRCGDKGPVDGHFRHACREIMPMFIPILGDPRSEEFLQRRQRAGRDHFSAERVGLEFLKVPLRAYGGLVRVLLLLPELRDWDGAYGEVSPGSGAFG